MPASSTIAIIGGGAAGFFGAIACAEAAPERHVVLLEKARQVLAKVRISGGGRCNVTHACFDPALLVQNYPRGGKELRGPFARFQPRDTIEWFQSRDVALKVESDGRIFPTTDNSETIINCLMQQAHLSKVELRTECGVVDCEKKDDGFALTLSSGEVLACDKVLAATGSAPKIYAWLAKLGHTVVPAVPSLFTFNIPNSFLHSLSGTSVPKATLTIDNTPLKQSGPLLVTHWGFSGPSVLKLSAWGARILHDMHYQAVLRVDWLPDFPIEALKRCMDGCRKEKAARQVGGDSPFPLSKNLWRTLIDKAGIPIELKWSAISNLQIAAIAEIVHAGTFHIDGKSTYKEEFVTCGGIKLSEVNFKTMESRVCPGLYFAGEILDIDGVTGGFNFQNAWTTAWIAGNAMGSESSLA